MAKGTTNFAQLITLLGARPADIVTELGVAKAVVSRWCNGKVKIMPGHGWDEKLTVYLFVLDGKLKHPVIPDILRTYFPSVNQGTEVERRELFARWLCVFGHKEAGHQKDGFTEIVKKSIDAFTPHPETHSEPEPEPEDYPDGNAVVFGVEGVQGAALQFLDLTSAMKEPQEILYVCPDGLDMYTRDEKFGAKLMDKLMSIFANGHTVSVVLRTDYKMTDVSAFSGRWLVAHLLGYIKSYYYDEFHTTYEDKMLVVVPGQFAMRVKEETSGSGTKLYTAISFDADTVKNAADEYEQYRKKSRQRFHYHFFEQPGGFLRDMEPLPDRVHYQFARLPHFCITDGNKLQKDFNLTSEEMQDIQRDFSLFLSQPGFYEPDTTVRHIFCEDDIENALLKNSHVSQELSTIIGRRVVINSQTLTNRLVLLRDLLESHSNYEVCFLSDEVFKKLTMQIACWGDRAAIGWIPGSKSTACKDYTNVNALTGFCGAVWEQIPPFARSRKAAAGKLATWLKKAKKYGYDVGMI